MGRPTLGNINLPKAEVIRILTEKKVELQTQLATVRGTDGKIDQWRKDVEDWDARVSRVILNQQVQTTVKYSDTTVNDHNPYIGGYNQYLAKVEITAVNMAEVFAIVGSRPEHPSYPLTSWDFRSVSRDLQDVDKYIALLNISTDTEVRLRPSDAIARLIT